MGKNHLGEFEELVLLVVAILKNKAYGLGLCDEIRAQTGRDVTIGAVHATVARLESKGLLQTSLGGSTNKRGGRRKRLIVLTASGKLALQESRDSKLNLWTQIPELAINK